MLLIVFLVTVTITYIVYFYISTLDYRRKISKLKCEPTLPLMGHNLGGKKDILKRMEKMWNNTGRDKFLLKLGFTHQVIITNPKDVEALLVKERILLKNVTLYNGLKGIIGDGIITANPVKWHAARKILTPAFHAKVIESNEDIFNANIKLIYEDITNTTNKDVDLFKIFFKTVLSTIIASQVGLNASLKNNSEYLDDITKLIAMTNEKIFSPWKSISFLYNLTSDGKLFRQKFQKVYALNEEILMKKIENNKDLIKDVNSGKNCLENLVEDAEFIKKKLGFLDLLLLARKNNGEPLLTEEIIWELLTFTVAGIETTAAASSFTLYNLATNPDIQEKVINEQLSITNGDLTKPVSFQDMKAMKYLDLVIKESLRLYPPAVFFGRKLVKDVILPDGTALPAGINLLFLPFLSHRNPDQFPEPEKFNPDRFINNTLSPGCYFPFSIGPRDCIGKPFALLQVKFYLCSLLRTLKFLPPVGPKPDLYVELGLKSSTGVLVRWEKRQYVQ